MFLASETQMIVLKARKASFHAIYQSIRCKYWLIFVAWPHSKAEKGAFFEIKVNDICWLLVSGYWSQRPRAFNSETQAIPLLRDRYKLKMFRVLEIQTLFREQGQRPRNE